MKGKLKEVWILALSLASIWDFATNNFTVSGNNYKPPTFIPLNQIECGFSNATQHKVKCDRGEVGVESMVFAIAVKISYILQFCFYTFLAPLMEP